MGISTCAGLVPYLKSVPLRRAPREEAMERSGERGWGEDKDEEDSDGDDDDDDDDDVVEEEGEEESEQEKEEEVGNLPPLLLLLLLDFVEREEGIHKLCSRSQGKMGANAATQEDEDEDEDEQNGMEAEKGNLMGDNVYICTEK